MFQSDPDRVVLHQNGVEPGRDLNDGRVSAPQRAGQPVHTLVGGVVQAVAQVADQGAVAAGNQSQAFHRHHPHLVLVAGSNTVHGRVQVTLPCL